MAERVFLHVTSGQGPVECRIAAAKLIAYLEREAKRSGLELDVAEGAGGDRHGPASVVVAIRGAGAETFVRPYLGTIQWIVKSPVRPNHRRRNWFVGVSRLPEIEGGATLREADVRFETMRAGGPGGQHQNTTQSAVRAVHVPSGVVVVARDERSQHRNKAIALERLGLILAQHAEVAKKEAAARLHGINHALERGNATLVFRADAFERS